MRSIKSFTVPAMAACALMAGTALGQTQAPSTPPATTQAAPPVTTPAPPPGVAPATPPSSGGLTARPITPPTHHRMTLAQRFDAANTTHDGHLTLAQAKAANMNSVVKNFDQMDVAKRGYVTIDDIHTFNRNRHRVRAGKAAPKLEAQ